MPEFVIMIVTKVHVCTKYENIMLIDASLIRILPCEAISIQLFCLYKEILL